MITRPSSVIAFVLLPCSTNTERFSRNAKSCFCDNTQNYNYYGYILRLRFINVSRISIDDSKKTNTYLCSAVQYQKRKLGFINSLCFFVLGGILLINCMLLWQLFDHNDLHFCQRRGRIKSEYLVARLPQRVDCKFSEHLLSPQGKFRAQVKIAKGKN